MLSFFTLIVNSSFKSLSVVTSSIESENFSFNAVITALSSIILSFVVSRYFKFGQPQGLSLHWLFTHSPIHPFTYSPIHPFTYSPIHPFTYSPIHLFPHSPIHLFTHSP